MCIIYRQTPHSGVMHPTNLANDNWVRRAKLAEFFSALVAKSADVFYYFYKNFLKQYVILVRRNDSCLRLQQHANLTIGSGFDLSNRRITQ